MEQFIILRGSIYNMRHIANITSHDMSIVFYRKDLPDIVIDYDQSIKCQSDIRVLRNAIAVGSNLIELVYGSHS